MSNQTSGVYAPGTYVNKDGDQRVAKNARQAVALAFEGYALKEAVPAEDATYRDLQAQAKELGIPANQSETTLRAAIAEATLNSSTPVDPADGEGTPDDEEN